MTKKYWLDWQKRANYTKNIILFSIYSDRKWKRGYGILNVGDRIIDIIFDSNQVEMRIKRINPCYIINPIGESIEKVTLSREDIASIEFYVPTN